MKRTWFPALAAILALTTGCNGGSSAGPSGGGSGGTGTAAVTATVDGVDFTADVVTAVRQSGAVVITGADASVFSVQIQFLDSGAGTITISPAGPASGTVQENSEIWSTAATGGTGTIEVTELTAAGAKGTFSFTTGTNNSAAPPERVVTNGTFDVTF